MRKNRDTWRELHDNIKVIKEEGLYPIAEFCIKTALRVMNFFDHFFDHLFDHLFDHRGNNENNKKNDL